MKTVLVSLITLCVGCSEANDGRPPVSLDAGGTVVDASTPPVQEAGPPVSKDAGMPVFPAVINEISGKGDEWVELYNPGDQAVDLSGFTVADLDKATNGPRTTEAAQLTAGTILAPKAYLIVAALSGDASVPVCPSSDPCVGAEWGISNKDGDALFLVNPQGTVVARGDYPANQVQTGQTWGRVPNGSGSFALNAPTPSKENKAP